MMGDQPLLPCPFCGGQARTFQYNGTAQASCAALHTECAGTDVVAPVAMWNRRALSAVALPGELEVVAFDGVAKQKLDNLIERGWKISGYALYQDGDHGLITTGGFVGWFSVAERNDAAARAELAAKEARVLELMALLNRAVTVGGDLSVRAETAEAEVKRLTAEKEALRGGLSEERREIAAGQAWDFVKPGLVAMNQDKGPAGVWSAGFRSGWDGATRAALSGSKE